MGTHNWGTPAPTALAAPNPDATIMALAPGVAMTPDATIMALAPGGAMTPMQTQNLALNTPRPPLGGHRCKEHPPATYHKEGHTETCITTRG